MRFVLRHTGTPEQFEFWGAPQKFRAFVGGIGSGKTRAGVLEYFRQPSHSYGMVVAPTYDMLRSATLETFFEVAEATGDPASSLIASHNASELVTVLKNGTKIRWRSGSDPSRLRGPNLNWAHIDEGAYFKDDRVMKVLLGRIRRPGPKRIWVTTSPNGFNWLYDWFVTAGVERRPDRFHVVHASTHSNVYLEPEFVEDLEANYTTDYAEQEIEGRFVDLGATMVRREWLRYLAVPSTGLIITMGVDLAISKSETADYTAIVVVGRRPGSGVAHILDAAHDQVSFMGGLKLIKAMARKWRPALVRIESVAFQEASIETLILTTHLPIQGVPRPPGIDKVMRFVPIAARYERQAIFHSPALQGSEFERHILAFPTAKRDDYADALELAINPAPIRVGGKAGGKTPGGAQAQRVFGRYRSE